MTSSQQALEEGGKGTATIRSLQIGNIRFEERPGGLARVYNELFLNLPKVNVSFRGLVAGSSQPVPEDARLEVFARSNEPLHRRMLKVRRSMRLILRNEPIDLIASHFALYTFPALHEIRKQPLVIHFHGPWALEASIEKAGWLKSNCQAGLERLVYGRASRFIVLSQAFACELARRYKVPEDAIRIVPAGVDTTRFNNELSRHETRERLGWPKNRFIVLAVRRLAHRMGLEDLIDAARLLITKAPDILVYIAGTGVLHQALEAKIDGAGLSNHVKLLGRVDDALLPLVYRAANLSVVPTTDLEGFGMVTLESLASGTPVMVTPVGGLPEVVQKLSPALIFERSGPDAIANGIGEVLRGERRLPDGAECRLYTENHFTWPIVAESVRRVYLEALA